MPTYNKLPQPGFYFQGKWYQKLVEDLQLAGKANELFMAKFAQFANWPTSVIGRRKTT